MNCGSGNPPTPKAHGSISLPLYIGLSSILIGFAFEALLDLDWLFLVCLSFSSLEANGQEERYWGTIIRNPPGNYVLKMDDGKILNAGWESGYDQWSIGQRIILTTENGSGIMFFKKQRAQLAVFPYNPAQIGK